MKGFILFILAIYFNGCTNSPTGVELSKDKDEDKAQVCPEGYKDISLTKANWEMEFDGYGKVIFNEAENTVYMEPKKALSPRVTHASLVLSKFNIESENFDIIVDYKNEAALRLTHPNPWEVFWLYFNYVPSGVNHAKTANYAIAKPNGFEVGRAARVWDQVYVKTTDPVTATFKEWHRLRVHQQNGVAKFYFNGAYVFEVPTSVLFTAHGKIGLYCEDAAVMIRRVCLK